MRQRSTKPAAPPEDVDQLVGRFLQDLERQETAPKTRASHRLDLLHFAKRFDQAMGERFGPDAHADRPRRQAISRARSP